MFNQGWRVVSGLGPVASSADVSPDTQATGAYMIVFRRDAGKLGDPGAEVTVYTFGEHNAVNDGNSPLVVTAQVGYEIRGDNPDRDVNDADYEYIPGTRTYANDRLGHKQAATAAYDLAWKWVLFGDQMIDWTGESGMMRQGGPVTEDGKQ